MPEKYSLYFWDFGTIFLFILHENFHRTLVLFYIENTYLKYYNIIVNRDNPSSFLFTDPYINYLYSPHVEHQTLSGAL